MAIEITDSEYDEFLALRHYYGLRAIQDSIAATASLKDDIDQPIRRTIVGLALLGCNPVWSCCGYDYPNQPLHKRHTYGSLYVLCERNERSWEYLRRLPIIGGDPLSQFWHYNEETRDGIPAITLIYQWDVSYAHWKPEDFHFFGELAQVRIHHLEVGLEQLKSLMSTEAVVRDTNERYRDKYTHWVYPALGDWNVTYARDFDQDGSH